MDWLKWIVGGRHHGYGGQRGRHDGGAGGGHGHGYDDRGGHGGRGGHGHGGYGWGRQDTQRGGGWDRNNFV